ncbi:MAG: hypothetical protein MI919_26165, partial [Holophagales bacterium]|nr:hypothetical protein [Holophagales bacterium]
AWSSLCRRLNGRRFAGLLLSRALAAGPLPWAEVLSVALLVTEALTRVHAKGGVIRDLRPGTVALGPDRKTAHFLDLGIAAAPESLEIVSPGSGNELVNAALRCASPEQILGEHLDRRSNLFSLGALLFELATGEAPFLGPTPLETAGRIVALEPPSLSDLGSEIPLAFGELVTRLLAKDPTARPASASAVVACLSAIEEGSPDPLRALDEADGAHAEIEGLYRQIDALLARRREGGSEAIDPEIDPLLARLRALQKAEADRFRAAFDERLSMPIEAGREILDRAAALRQKLEGLAAPHPSAS